jgi:hypothetical protein
LSLSFEDIDVEIKKKMTGSTHSSKDIGEKGKDTEYVKFKFNCMKRVGNDSEEEKKRTY